MKLHPEASRENAAMQGETAPVIGRLLGHESAGSTFSYTNLAETTVRNATDAMGANLGGAVT